jgi:hypothetical protein
VTFADPLQVGERRIYLDMSLVKPASDKVVIGKPNWLMIVDGKTQFKISRFYAAKSGIVKPETSSLVLGNLQLGNLGIKTINQHRWFRTGHVTTVCL